MKVAAPLHRGLRRRLHQLTRRWVVGVVAAVAVLFGATLIVTGPSAKPRVAPAKGPTGILAATRSWAVMATLHGTGGSGRPATGSAGGGVPRAPASLQLGSIACTAAGRTCIAVGGPFVARRVAGGGWRVRAAPAAVGYLTSVSCSGPADCLAVAQPSGAAVGDLAMSSTDGGTTWTPRALPGEVEGISSVDCATAGECTAVGEGRHGPVVATTVDGGAAWHVAPAPAGLGGLDAVGCAPSRASLCVAVGWLRGPSSAAIAVLSSGVVERAPSGVGALDSVSCPTASTCLVGGFLTPSAAGGSSATRRFPGAVARSSDGGRSWTLLRLPSGAGPVNSLSCVGSAGCVAAGVSASPAGKPSAKAAGGRTGAASVAPAAGAGPPGMAITTADGGRSWQVDRLPPSASGLASVTCAPALAARGAPACVATAAGPQSSSLVLAGG